MPEFKLKVNNKEVKVDIDGDTPLLWVLRDTLGLTGTKYGCGEGICGSCTVHINGKAERSCSILIKDAAGKSITTIEGFAENPNHPIFKSWIELEVSQCGYCQPGQIMTLAALLNEKDKPTKTEIDEAMSGVLCRCGTYHRIRKAIEKLVEEEE
ncbi:MAG: (2Fe-2S)-binding protein [Melioribacteraceae bacterium]|nr:(2Fe-2S)-binding protein [Melioribacteraceae bacterium]